jgi:GTP-binding protein
MDDQDIFPDWVAPRIAIVGRPNVGKSTLFNRLVGKKLALVDDTPGVTRDRREGQARLFDLEFTAIDTAGLEEDDAFALAGRMRQQTEAAIRTADLALMVIDARAGVTPLDRHFATWVRTLDVPVVLVANKAEGRAAEAGFQEAFDLGLGEPVGLSAEHGEGLADLYQAVTAITGLPPQDVPEAPELDQEAADAALLAAPLKLAIVGRPNAGKSTLINTLLGEQRLVTGPEAGITRDSIAVEWEWHDRKVRLIDTAGLRKRAKVTEKLEKLSAADTKRAIDFAEVVVLLLDATLGLEGQDLRIASLVLEEGRALIIVLNKWDVVADAGGTFRGVAKALEEGLAQVKGVPLLTTSGETGRGLDQLMEAAFKLREGWSRRVSTGQLNRWFEGAIERNPPPAPGGRRIKLRYITQARTRPPTFLVFGNRVDELPESYRRYLVNGLREEVGFMGVPIRLQFRGSRNPFAESK